MEPLLFLLYTNAFENCLENTTLNTYAGDTCVVIASGNFNDLITEVFERNVLSFG